MTARINEVLNFLERYYPSRLVALKEREPELRTVLEPDWAGISSPATRLRAEATLQALQQLLPTLTALLPKAVKRVRASQRLADAGVLITALSTLCTAVLAVWPQVPPAARIAPAVLATAASLWTLRSKALDRTLFDRSIGAQAAIIADAHVSVPRLIIELTAYLDSKDPVDYSDKANALIESANALFRDVNRVAIDIES